MASFAQTLRSFSSGSLSREDLFKSVDTILSGSRVDTPWLLKILDQEHHQVSLPQEVYDAVKKRVIDATGGVAGAMEGEGARRGETSDDDDLNRTQMATSFFPSSADDEGVTTTSESARSSDSSERPVPEVPIKGTGDVLNDRFVLEERVGTGGMSTVYRALDRRKLEANDRDPYIAVKILNLEFRAHPDSLIALQREAKKCHKLAHPNIVRAYDFDRDGATVYMTMEYLTGHSLAKLLRDPGYKGMSFQQALPIIRGMAEALAYAHKNGIVHADFKPANVILTDEGEIKVIDFGIARAFHKQGDSDTEATRFDPGSLGALTPTYASPEMLEHEEPDPRDDVYALACIVYEMLTGRHPFGRRQANEARDGGLMLQRKTLTRRQWRALRSALQFDRDKRTPSVSKFFTDINPEYSRTPILVAIAASVFFTAFLIGMGAFIYESDTFRSVLTGEETRPVEAPIRDNPPENGSAVATIVREEPVTTAPPVAANTDIGAAQPEQPIEKAEPAPTDTELLQKVQALLNGRDCSALSASVERGQVGIRGFIPESASVDALTAELKALRGVSGITTDIQPLTDSMCDVVNLYRRYWVSNKSNRSGVAIETGNPDGVFVDGEALVLKLKTPAYDSFVNVDYFSKDGQVVHMLPSPRINQNQAPANYSAILGDLGQWVVSEPYGRDLVVILTSPSMLFRQLRDEYEKTSDYLEAMSKAFDTLEASNLGEQIAADFVVITTKAKE